MKAASCFQLHELMWRSLNITCNKITWSPKGVEIHYHKLLGWIMEVTSKLVMQRQVNSQWDIEYREQEEAFRISLWLTAGTNWKPCHHCKIEAWERTEIKSLKFELDRSGWEMDSVRLRLESVEQQRADSSSHHEGVSLQKVTALEEKITLLRQHTLNSKLPTSYFWSDLVIVATSV